MYNSSGGTEICCAAGAPGGNNYYWGMVPCAQTVAGITWYNIVPKSATENSWNRALAIDPSTTEARIKTLESGDYQTRFCIQKINKVDTGKYLTMQSLYDINGSTYNNTRVAVNDEGTDVQFRSDKTNTPAQLSTQLWTFELVGDGTPPIYRIKNKKTGKYLQVDTTDQDINEVSIGEDDSTDDKQKWLLLGEDLNNAMIVSYAISSNKYAYYDKGVQDTLKNINPNYTRVSLSQVIQTLNAYLGNVEDGSNNVKTYANDFTNAAKFRITYARALDEDRGDFYTTIKSSVPLGGNYEKDNFYHAVSLSKDGAEVNCTKVNGTTKVVYRRIGDSPAADQQWYFKALGNNEYAIQNIATGEYLCLERTEATSDGSSNIDANVVTAESFDYNSDDYRWYVVIEPNGDYSISCKSYFNCNFNAFQNKLADETPITYYLADGMPASRWLLDFDKTAPAYGENLGDTFWAYISPTTVENSYLRCGDTLNPADNIYDAKLYCKTAESDSAKRKQENYWKFERNADGSYKISSCNVENSVIDKRTYNGGFNGDRDVSIWRDNGIYGQRWFIRKYAGGYTLESKLDGKVLTLTSDDTAENYIRAVNPTVSDSQLFNIIKTDLTVPNDLLNVKMRLFNYGSAINSVDNKVLYFFNGSENVNNKGQHYVDTYGLNSDEIASADYKPTMSPTLGTDGYPLVTANGDEKGSIGSLKYLFDDAAGDSTGFVKGNGSADSYNLPVSSDNASAAAYISASSYQSQRFEVNNPTSLFKKNPNNGLYYYDSLLNSAYFERDTDPSGKKLSTGNFKLYDYTMSLPLAQLDTGFEYQIDTTASTITGMSNFTGNFYPFNIAHEKSNVSYHDLSTITDDSTAKNGRMKMTYDNDKATNNADYIKVKSDRTPEKEGDYINDYVKEGDYVPVNYSIDTNTVMDCWFGMTMECEFEQTSDGTYDGKPLQFNFKGDDDVWVYLDGVLILDIGGTHKALNGNINFRTGEVSYESKDSGSTTKTLKELYEAVQNSGYSFRNTPINSNYIADNFNASDSAYPNTFKAGTKHVLNFFYLERGGAVSSCCLNFNLPKGTSSVTKEVVGSNSKLTDNTEYEFRLEKANKQSDGTYTYTTFPDVTYLLENADGSKSEEKELDAETGIFKLKAGQTAYFHNIDDGTQYRVTELACPGVVETSATYTRTVVDSDGKKTVYTENMDSKPGGSDYDSNIYKLETNVTQNIVFKNTLVTSTITVKKVVTDKESMPNSVYNFGLHVYKGNTDYGTIDFSIKGSQLNTGYTIDNLPAGASYDLWEYYPYDTSNRYDAPTFTDGTNTVTGRLVEASKSPSKGDFITGTINNNTVTVTNKLLDNQKITLTIKYYDRKVVSGEVANIDTQETAFSKQVTLNDKNATFSNNKITSINLEKIITDAGVSLDNTNALNNVVDDYELFTSQQQAINLMGNNKRTYTLGKGDIDSNNKPFASHKITAEEAVYHTNSKRQPIKDLSKQEKWVTYYQSGTKVDAEAENFIDFDKITNVTVWLYNKPHKYTVTTHVPANENDKDNSKTIYFDAYYNQLLGSYDGTGTSGDELKFYKDEYEYYCDKYSIPLDEYDARGYTKNDGGDPSNKTYTDAGALKEVGNDKFSFWTYGEDADTSEVISTDLYYNYRVTRDMHLYAQYGEKKQGVYTTSNGIDTYYTNDGTKKLRLNTVMNPYGFPDGSKDGNGNKKIDYTFVAYLDIKDGLRACEFTTYERNTLSSIIKTAVNAQLNLNNFPSEGRKVIYADAVIDTENYGKFVIVVDKIDNDRVKLTNKNRIQFVTSYTAKPENNGKRILAFTGMRYNDSSCFTEDNKGWFVSTSFADHKLNY